MRKELILIYCITLISSCGQFSSIEKPLPEQEKELKFFPIHIQGDYLNSEDNSILTITDNSVTKTYDFDFKFLKDSIGPDNYIKNDTMFNKYSNEKEKVKLSGDTIIQHIYKTIPLFQISPDNVLKKYNEHYFLNNRFSEFDWIVTILSIRKGIMKVQGAQDINNDNLDNLSNANSDTTSFDINSIRKPLNNVLIENGIGRSNYLRVRKNGR